MVDNIKANVRKWVAALRSGDYKQGKGYLISDRTVEPRHCCIGVLCEVLGHKPIIIKKGIRRGYLIEGDFCLQLVPDSVAKAVGFDYNFFRRLAEYNDEGVLFDEIADLIERKSDETL